MFERSQSTLNLGYLRVLVVPVFVLDLVAP